MPTHIMNLTRNPFVAIRSGHKDIELRLYDKKRQQVQVGDSIIFTCEAESITTQVEALLIYKSFEALIEDFALSRFGGGQTKNELLQDVARYYSQEDQAKNGVVGIKISLIRIPNPGKYI